MQYAILCYDSQAAVDQWSKETDEAVMAALGAVQERLAAQKRLGPVARLANTTAAKTMRKGNAPIVMDGPFAETKEQLLGFYIIDCETEAAAIEVMRELAEASGSAGAFELRPLRLFRPGVISSAMAGDGG